MLFAGIRREHQFSPNHIGNDEAIFCLTANHLMAKGHQVNEYAEDECMSGIGEQYVFSMARKPQVAHVLQEMERNGAKVINSGYGVENCYRSNMTRLLGNEGVSSPASMIVSTDNPSLDIFNPFCDRPFWVKRGDFHAIHKEDVSYARNAAEGCEMLKEYARRGIDSVVLCEHIAGDLVKFYGVLGTDFFYWFYPTELGHSKFGNERINGEIQHLAFQPKMLEYVTKKAAIALSIDIYGGDAIVTPEGAIYLIDMNDWPSFAPCREQAATAIARRICQRIESGITIQ